MVLASILAAALAFAPADAQLADRTAREFVAKCTPRDVGTAGARRAVNFILDTASAVGCDVYLDRFTAATPKGVKTLTNLHAEIGSDPDREWIVLASHFDTKTGVNCPGANDGASTTGLLVGLANALMNWKTPRGNVMLVWLDGEECMDHYGDNDGFWGSRRAAAQLKLAGRKVKAVIVLDMLGDRDLHIVVPRNGTRTLRKAAQDAASRLDIVDKVALSDELIKDDHVAFLLAGMPAVDLIDFDYGSKPGLNDYWHSEKDTVDKISEASLLTAGKLVCEMLNALL